MTAYFCHLFIMRNKWRVGKEKLQEHRGMWLSLFEQLSRARKDRDSIKKRWVRQRKKSLGNGLISDVA